MAEPPYLQLIASFWEWSQQEINTWLRAFGNLKEVLAERDLLSEDTFKSSLRFSAFNILIAMLVDLPPKVVFAPKGVSMLMFAALFMLYYIMTLAFGLSLKLISIIVMSKTPMRICLVFALFTTIYWPLNNLLDYVTFSNPELYAAVTTPDSTILTIFTQAMTAGSMAWIMSGFISMIICAYIFISILPAIRYSFRVGWFRGILILFGSSTLVAVFQILPLRPISQAIIKIEFAT